MKVKSQSALKTRQCETRSMAIELGRAQRQARAGPLLEQTRRWLQDLLSRLSTMSDIAQAIGCSAGALQSADALRRRRPDGDRQQRSGTRIALREPGTQE